MNSARTMAPFFVFVAVTAFQCGGSGSSSNNDSDTESGAEETIQIGGPNEDNNTLGLPVSKTAYTTKYTVDDVQGTADHYDFLENPDDYTTTTSTLHGTEVSVGVHKSAAAPADWAEIMTNCWHSAWHVFGGYKYDRYAILLRSPNSTDTSYSLSQVGVSFHGNDIGRPDNLFCHEIFHSWNGKLIAYQPDGTENLFQRETWVVEGATVYYAVRLWNEADPTTVDFNDAMMTEYEPYNTAKGGRFDVGIQAMADIIGSESSSVQAQTSHDATDVLYSRGTMISYRLDQELENLGFSLDAVMANLYVNFGLENRQWTQSDFEAAVQTISGQDFSGFFDNNVESNATISLDTFTFFNRYE